MRRLRPVNRLAVHLRQKNMSDVLEDLPWSAFEGMLIRSSGIAGSDPLSPALPGDSRGETGGRNLK